MLLPADQRRMLGAFLRARREALTPACMAEAVVFSGRRRTPGLRREEVAQLCGISTAWYSWIEQGRDISLSAGSLARLSDALRLTAAERAYLFELSRLRDPSPALVDRYDGRVPAELRAVLQAVAAPAYLMDRRWHAHAWNSAAAVPGLGLRALRRARGVTLRQLADATGISVATFSRYERGLIASRVLGGRRDQPAVPYSVRDLLLENDRVAFALGCRDSEALRKACDRAARGRPIDADDEDG